MNRLGDHQVLQECIFVKQLGESDGLKVRTTRMQQVGENDLLIESSR